MERYHFHEFFEINYVLSGDVRFFVADQIYQATSGSLLVFNYTDLHRSASPPSALYERIVLYFSPEDVQGLSSAQTNLLGCFVGRAPDYSHCIQLNPEQSAVLLSLFDKATLYHGTERFGSDVYEKIALAEILLNINELFSSSSSVRSLRSVPEMKRVLPMLIYINEHLHEDLSLERLAKTFYISKYHISHIFKKATGFTPKEYIIHRRIIKARKLLKQRELSVQSIGECVGFNNNSHFIRAFKALVGTSPKQYSLSSHHKKDLKVIP
ncbi:MAG: helix-turn-helix domain-containing protein [Bacillota bacterium]|nr:MAG: helix-turn-helix domain-containing protein [Bacillota bacterium]